MLQQMNALKCFCFLLPKKCDTTQGYTEVNPQAEANRKSYSWQKRIEPVSIPLEIIY